MWSFNTAPRGVNIGLHILFCKSKHSEGNCKHSSEVIFYLTYSLTLCEVLKSPGSAVSKKHIPEGECGSFTVLRAKDFEKMIAAFVSWTCPNLHSQRGRLIWTSETCSKHSILHIWITLVQLSGKGRRPTWRVEKNVWEVSSTLLSSYY